MKNQPIIPKISIFALFTFLKVSPLSFDHPPCHYACLEARFLLNLFLLFVFVLVAFSLFSFSFRFFFSFFS